MGVWGSWKSMWSSRQGQRKKEWIKWVISIGLTCWTVWVLRLGRGEENVRETVSSTNLNPICWWKEPSCWMLLFPWQSWFIFMCTSCSICYHATQTAEIFHILQLFLVHHILYLSLSLHDFFPHSFTFHRIFQFQLVYQSCHVASSLTSSVAQCHLHISQC